MTDAVLTEIADGVATLWLNRPERGNALGDALVEALDTALDQALARGARLIALRGKGRHLCTGLDLSDIETASEGDLALRVLRIELFLQKLHALPVTTLAVAQGRVFGAGADVFAACDHRLALDGAGFAFPGPAFGLVLGTARLAGMVGEGAARRLLLAGGTIEAPEAKALGLVTQCLGEDALPAALDAARLAAHRLDATTVAALHGRTRRADDAGDLAALARSVARPGLKQRVLDYRARTLAPKARPA